MKIIETETSPETAKNYVRLRRGIIDHLTEEKLTWDEFSLLEYLIIRANPKNGKLFTSYNLLSNETHCRYSINRINKLLLSLKEKLYIYYPEHKGSGKPFEVSIDKYPLSNKLYLKIIEDNEAELFTRKQNFVRAKKSLVKGLSIDNR